MGPVLTPHVQRAPGTHGTPHTEVHQELLHQVEIRSRVADESDVFYGDHARLLPRQVVPTLREQPALEEALSDLRGCATPGEISGALHNGLARAIAAVAARVGQERVVLTGGCFQNLRLTEATLAALRAAGHEPIFHRRVPPNDGGIALGQAVWAGWSEQGGAEICA